MKKKKKNDPADFFRRLDLLNNKLLKNIKKNLPELKKLLEEMSGHWYEEDLVYRFFHGSFKVYYIQSCTVQIVGALLKLAPEKPSLCESFMEIYRDGVDKKFSSDHNKNWAKHTRPLVEAFFHSMYFLRMIVKYGSELKKAPKCLPSGWAAVLELYMMR